MPRLLSLSFGCGPESNYFHTPLFRFDGDINVDIVDTRMRKQPHGVALVEVIALHDLHPIALNPLKEEKLVYAHLPGNSRKKSKRELNHRMKSDEASDARIHFLNGNGGMPAPEGMHPSPGLDTVGHHLRGLADIFHLRVFDARHHIARIVKPLFCEHN